MKRVTLFLTLIVGSGLASCADPLEKRSPEEVQNQIERGVTGQGRVGPENRVPNDTANEHAVPQDHP